jgi:ADP-ribosyl-[dinitrogen reductase] hydrolase
MDTSRAEGVLIGLACGDALGRPVEFDSPGAIERDHGTLREMIGHGTWNQPAGTITDDTEQALCLARSLAEQSTFDPADVAERFVDWYETGPFDIGIMTRRSLERLQRGTPWHEAGQKVWEKSPEGSNAGNGSVMRCPPLALAYGDSEKTDKLARVSRDSSRITHADPRCTYGCAVLNLIIAGLLRKEREPLSDAVAYVRGDAPAELVGALDPIARGKDVESLENSGYVVHTLQTALHDGFRAESLEEAIVTSVNRGGDTDTIGAVTGAVAGARFGAGSIPDSWLAEIKETEELGELARRLTTGKS